MRIFLKPIGIVFLQILIFYCSGFAQTVEADEKKAEMLKKSLLSGTIIAGKKPKVDLRFSARQ